MGRSRTFIAAAVFLTSLLSPGGVWAGLALAVAVTRRARPVPVAER